MLVVGEADGDDVGSGGPPSASLFIAPSSALPVASGLVDGPGLGAIAGSLPGAGVAPVGGEPDGVLCGVLDDEDEDGLVLGVWVPVDDGLPDGVVGVPVGDPPGVPDVVVQLGVADGLGLLPPPAGGTVPPAVPLE